MSINHTNFFGIIYLETNLLHSLAGNYEASQHLLFWIGRQLMSCQDPAFIEQFSISKQERINLITAD